MSFINPTGFFDIRGLGYLTEAGLFRLFLITSTMSHAD